MSRPHPFMNMQSSTHAERKLNYTLFSWHRMVETARGCLLKDRALVPDKSPKLNLNSFREDNIFYFWEFVKILQRICCSFRVCASTYMYWGRRCFWFILCKDGRKHLLHNIKSFILLFVSATCRVMS